MAKLNKPEPDNQEYRLSAVEDGRLAGAAHSYLSEPIAKAKQDAISKMINMYRAGETTHDKLVGIAAELHALAKLEQDLLNDVRKAERALEKEQRNG